mgnify:CR=1 FL=1
MSAPALTVTESAAEQLKAIMDNQDLTDVGVRVFVRHACGCGSVNYGMGFDEERENDLVIQSDGLQVLISPRSQQLLENATLDFVELKTGEFQFIFINSAGIGIHLLSYSAKGN